MKFIYWFAYYNFDSPSVRYRGKYPLEWMYRERGIGFRLVVPGYRPAAIMRFLQAYFAALLFPRKDSVIVVQRVYSGFIYAGALKLLVRVRRGRTVYDLDDADYLEHPPSTIHYFARHCRCVSAGSQAIVRYLRRFNPNVAHVTSPVIDLGIRKSGRSEVFTIGWVGDLGGDHRHGLFTLLFPALAQFRLPVRFVCIGVHREDDMQRIMTFFKDLEDVELDMPMNVDWEDEAWLQQQIARFDVGIAILMDTPVQRAKSGIKAKQYMNNGVPVLSTDLPENNHVVQHGSNGFLFSNVDDLVSRLHSLFFMDEQQRRLLSENALSSVVGFDHARYCADLFALVANNIPEGKDRFEDPALVDGL